MTLATSLPHSPGRVPLWLKLAYTAFMAILVPVYLYYYGPTNFLYFCDVALLLTLLGIWIDSPLLICFFFMPPPRPDPGLTPVNINYVWGTSDHAPQTFVPPAVWFIGLMIGLPAVLFAPVHFLLLRFAPSAPRTA